MDGGEQRTGRSRSSRKLPVWIIEHVWAHKLMDIQEVVDPSSWPDVDSQPLSLEDSWRLRVASAQAFSIVKSRDMGNFERVLDFLESTYRLLPRLVAAIKHMKILFGLKTMSQREMFLMRKNHVDFKSFAQTLAVDKSKLEDYMKNQMEEQYGQRYARKVEDRLLDYLQQLETVLPADTYIDKIMKKQSPATQEEKLLLEVITSDSTTIVATLRKLLHCDVASCRPAGISQPPERGKQGVEISHLSSPSLDGSSSNGSPLLLGNHDAGDPQQPEEGCEAIKMEEDKDSSECAPSPQFCSRHQRWVKSILRGCPDDCSEELLHHANVSSSPLMFQSSSSTSSSQDLTPSNLIPCHPDKPPSQTSTHLQTAVQASQPANPGDEQSSGPHGAARLASGTEHLPQSLLSRLPVQPSLLLPVVRLVDIASFWRSCSASKHHQSSTMLRSKPAPSSSSPQASTGPRCRTSNIDSTFVPAETRPTMQTAPESSSSSWQAAAPRTVSKLSRRFRRACTTPRHSQVLTEKPSAEQLLNGPGSFPATCLYVPQPPAHDSSTSSSHAENWSSACDAPPAESARPPSQTYTNLFPCSTRPHSTIISAMSAGRPASSEVHRVQRDERSRAAPLQALQAGLLQPYVSLTRLSTAERVRASTWTASARRGEAEQSCSQEEERKEMEGNTDSSFDVNSLYSSGSSSSDGEDFPRRDPDYKPHMKRKRLILEYESARVLK
ncbi:uncharacterized protein LOC121647289 isoform X2 [Melanotaenia boesemani]|uniref:uncharacterized protein LOC121647289 isoform X2 n=1 Tax=Melanotaenia boesemani TaxID=1250792 RepID=UPI001C059706|nr:uncharacterized protein LOC121647289 isoform X2 [Melanotaenia boesemani]